MRKCGVCGGDQEQGITIMTMNLGFGLLIVKDVPALICTQCGEKWLTPDVVSKIEKMANEVKNKRPELEIISFDKAA